MEVNRQNAPSRLTLKMQTGTDPDSGKLILKSISFSNLDVGAEDEDVYLVALQLAGLSQYTLDSVIRVDTAQLVSS